MPSPLDKLAPYFGPGTFADQYSRMMTPGIRHPQPSPEDDPFYARGIQTIWNGPAPTFAPPGPAYAQQVAQGYGDTGTEAAATGVRKRFQHASRSR